VDPFILVDVGCAGGIGPIFRSFRERLTAYAFDPNIDVCDGLRARETLPGVQYVPAFVGAPPDHPAVVRRGGKPHVQGNPWSRLAIAETMKIRSSPQAGSRPRLADSGSPICLPEFFAERNVTDVDFIKIDVDGADYEILQTLDKSVHELGVLGIGIEVNYCGTDDESAHTFHNVDRFMRRHGYNLFHLTIRTYSASALPDRYQYSFPAQSISGRPLQGDAFYAVDLGDLTSSVPSSKIAPPKLIKLAFLFSCFGLFDCAAEILITHRNRVANVIDVDRALEVLCSDIQDNAADRLSYSDYLDAFNRDDARFYGRTSLRNLVKNERLRGWIRSLVYSWRYR
jgi:FkbM family methyltransferase